MRSFAEPCASFAAVYNCSSRKTWQGFRTNHAQTQAVHIYHPGNGVVRQALALLQLCHRAWCTGRGLSGKVGGVSRGRALNSSSLKVMLSRFASV